VKVTENAQESEIVEEDQALIELGKQYRYLLELAIAEGSVKASTLGHERNAMKSITYLPIKMLKTAYRTAFDSGIDVSNGDLSARESSNSRPSAYTRSSANGPTAQLKSYMASRPLALAEVEELESPGGRSRASSLADSPTFHMGKNSLSGSLVSRSRATSLVEIVQDIVDVQTELHIQSLADQQRLEATHDEEEQWLREHKIFYEGVLEKSTPSTTIWQVRAVVLVTSHGNYSKYDLLETLDKALF
jgi:hypothetical protein